MYNIDHSLRASLSCSISVVIIYIILICSISLNPPNTALATVEENQPNINATSVFDTGQMVLGDNVKHLIILIPDKGHHGPGELDEARFIAQPFLPQNVLVGPGTQVAWFNGDVGHEHNIVVRDATVFNSLRQVNLQNFKPQNLLSLTIQENLNMQIQ